MPATTSGPLERQVLRSISADPIMGGFQCKVRMWGFFYKHGSDFRNATAEPRSTGPGWCCVGHVPTGLALGSVPRPLRTSPVSCPHPDLSALKAAPARGQHPGLPVAQRRVSGQDHVAPGKLPPPRATQSHSRQGLKGCSFDTGHHRHPRSMSCIWLGKSLTGSEAWKELVKEASVESVTRAVHTQFTLTVFEAEPHDANWARAGRRDERDIPTYVKESNLHLNMDTSLDEVSFALK